MRKNLYRGKTNKGEWKEGNLVIEETDNSEVNFIGNNDIETVFYIREIKGYWDTFWNQYSRLQWKTFYEKVAVIPETVGQFTGLPDKNDKRIFEGDIIQGTITSAWAKRIIRCEVAYIKDGFYSIEHKQNGELHTHKLAFARDIEVIGNIHDNPELLEGE